MKKTLIAAALVAAGSLALQDISTGHGGTYRGPGDTVPPGAGAPPAGGGTPGPAGPSGPSAGPATPSTPGASGPAGTPGAAPTGGGAARGGPTTGGDMGLAPDLTVWSFWWEFNKDPYLNLKAAIHGGGAKTGSDDFFLGHGEQQQAKDTYKPTEQQIREKIVPALLSALENETNNDIVTGCMIALAKIGDRKSESGESEFEKVISTFLTDSNQEIAETAALALGILGNEATVPTLEHLLRDDSDGRKLVGSTEVDYRTRAFAAYGLGLIGHATSSEETRQEIVRTLAEICVSDKSSVKDIRAACMISLGLVPLQTIHAPVPAEAEEKAKSPDPWASRIGQIQFVFDFFENDRNDFITRAHCPEALARLLRGLPDEDYAAWKETVAKSLLDRLSKHSDERQREVEMGSVLALGQIGDNDEDELDADIREELIAVMEGQIADQQGRNYATIALAKSGGTPGTGRNPGGGLEDIREVFAEQIVRGKSTIRPWSGLAIGVLGHRIVQNGGTPDPELSVALREALEEEGNPDRVGAYMIAAGMLKDQESIEILERQLDSFKTDEARGYACVGLGLLGSRGSIEKIQGIVRDSKYRPDLLKQAAIGLGLLGDKDLVQDLTAMLREAKGLSAQAAISSALGFIGDARSIDPLVVMLHDDSLTETARGFAAVALGIVADKEPLPWNSKISVDLNYRATTPTLNEPSEGTGIVNIL